MYVRYISHELRTPLNSACLGTLQSVLVVRVVCTTGTDGLNITDVHL